MNRADAQTYSPPKAVQEAAQRAVRWIDEGRAGSGFTPTGRTRAGQLARGEAVSLDVVERMASYFARHAPDTRATGFDAGEEGYPTPGRVAWDAWGGDAAMRWANAILDEIERKAARDAQRSDAAPLVRMTSAPVRLDAQGASLDPHTRALLAPPARLPDGAWRIEALAARGGEPKAYPHGLEMVPTEELDRAAPRFAGVPVTMEHPEALLDGDPEGAPLIHGARVLGARMVRDAVAPDGALIVSLAVPDLPRVRGVSVGWRVGRIDATTSPPSQRDLHPDHLALTPTPRVQGAALRLDAQPQGRPLMKLKIKDQEVEIPDDVGNLIKAEMDTLMSDKLKLQAELDRMRGASEAMDSKRRDAERADAIRAQARELAALYARARPHLAPEDVQRLDSMDADAIRAAVVKRLRPTMRLDGQSVEYVRAAYDVAVADAAARTKSEADQVERLDGRTPAPAPAPGFGRSLDAKWLKPQPAKV
jgi:hypothetical protein